MTIASTASSFPTPPSPPSLLVVLFLLGILAGLGLAPLAVLPTMKLGLAARTWEVVAWRVELARGDGEAVRAEGEVGEEEPRRREFGEGEGEREVERAALAMEEEGIESRGERRGSSFEAALEDASAPDSSDVVVSLSVPAPPFPSSVGAEPSFSLTTPLLINAVPP